MGARSSFEEKLARLSTLELDPPSDESLAELRAALAGANSLLAAKAAAVVGEYGLSDLAPDLVSAFGRFMEDPVKRDKTCAAKTSIAEALNELGAGGEELFLNGVRHVQMEPTWGGQVDTADALRGHCAEGLARIGYPGAFYELAQLLMDEQVQARRAAVRVVASLPCERAELLLRMKVLSGDAEEEVLGECFSGLLSIDGDRSLPFVAAFLGSENPSIAEEAALALGESRRPGALGALRSAWDAAIGTEAKKRLLLPIALLRLDEAFEFLLRVIEEGFRDLAAEAVKAVHVCAQDEDRERRVATAVADRDEAAVSEAFVGAFSGMDQVDH